jgi:thymidylate synthase (FAD)
MPQEFADKPGSGAPVSSSLGQGKPVVVEADAARRQQAPLESLSEIRRSKPGDAVARLDGESDGQSRLIDLMGGDTRWQIDVLDHGFVALLDLMPRLVPEGQTADQAIVQAARVSYGQGTKKVNEDRGLIRYLLRHRHTTPFEMVEFKFHMAMPIFVARQWIRHRTASVNEYSGRYSVMPDRFYRPGKDQIRKQSSANRQGGNERLTDDASGQLTQQAFLAYLERSEQLYEQYKTLVDAGVSREMARIGLPISLYTEWYWKVDLHNLLRFLALRMDVHAQEEIRAMATAMYRLIEPLVPATVEAWRDYEVHGVHLTALEVKALQQEIAELRAKAAQLPAATVISENKREQSEWVTKRGMLGF